jgi:hypothetical protein
MKIYTSETKTTGVYGKNIQRVKTEIESTIIEQVPNFN